MFQTFTAPSDPTSIAPRIASVRKLMQRAGVDALLVPRADEHQGEYVAPCSERLRWLTGFSGSAGAAIVLRERAVIFVDGRYTLQVRQQADMALFQVESLVDNPPANWLAGNIGKGARIGFDPWLHTISEAAALRRSAERAGAELVPLAQNPIDAIWQDRPRAPLGPLGIHPNELSGELARDKLARLGLSSPKIKTVKALGHAMARGEIDLDALGEMPADDAHAALVKLHGIGPWTADIYLLFCLGHADAWPAGDLALQEAARTAFNLRRRPDAKALTRLAEAWRPWRGVAAHLLWAYYKAVKQRDGVPVGPTSPAGVSNG